MNEETANVTQQETEALQSAQSEQENVQEPSEPQNKKKKAMPFIIAGAVVLIALLVGIGIYNTPENRVNRQLELGQKYLEEENYEQAALAFEEAIAIDDRCLEAYVGGLEAYLGADDVSGAQDFYDRTLTMLSGLDTDFLAENMDYAVELYLAAEKVYGDDWNRIAEVLEEGYTVTGEDDRVKDKLIENYIQIGKKETEAGSYEEALTVYDRLLELDSANTETISGLCDCLNKYINILMEAGRYDKIRALAEKYRDVAVNVDFGDILARIAELERIEAENRAFMQKVYDLMAAQDYEEGMCELYGSEETEAFIERLENDNYIYFPDSNDSQTGVGAGVYQYEDEEDGTVYYFYYGDYANGERKGSGTEFLEFTTGYYVFSGAWDNDAPNGEGTETRVGGMSYSGNGMSYDKVSNGMLMDGLWDGQVRSMLTYRQGGEVFDVSFSAVKGMPTEDKTEEYLSVVWWAERPEEGEYIYAFDYHPNTDTAWWYFGNEGELIGIVGFTE